MAGMKLEGLPELIRKFDDVKQTVLVEATEAFQDAAADVFIPQIKAAAPVAVGVESSRRRVSGSLRASVGKKISKNRSDYTGSARARFLVGPINVKSKNILGFYGYFLEKGWRIPLGPRKTYKSSLGKLMSTRRLERSGRGTSHSQQGLSSFKQMPAPYPNWFHNAIETTKSAAYEAGARAFHAIVNRVAGR